MATPGASAAQPQRTQRSASRIMYGTPEGICTPWLSSTAPSNTPAAAAQPTQPSTTLRRAAPTPSKHPAASSLPAVAAAAAGVATAALSTAPTAEPRTAPRQAAPKRSSAAISAAAAANAAANAAAAAASVAYDFGRRPRLPLFSSSGSHATCAPAAADAAGAVAR